MTNESSTIVQRLWNYCNVLRDDGTFVGAGQEATLPMKYNFLAPPLQTHPAKLNAHG
jgi:hypothetical protein